jgi:hypothetical protein
MVVSCVSSRDAGSGMERRAPSLVGGVAALLATGAPELLPLAGWFLTVVVLLPEVFAAGVFAFVVEPGSGCVQLETPRVASSASVIRERVKRLAVQNFRDGCRSRPWFEEFIKFNIPLRETEIYVCAAAMRKVAIR